MRAKKAISLVLSTSFGVGMLLGAQVNGYVAAEETTQMQAQTEITTVNNVSDGAAHALAETSDNGNTLNAQTQPVATTTTASTVDVTSTTELATAEKVVNGNNLPVSGTAQDDAGKYSVVWKTPVVIYGVGLSPEEVAQSKTLLGLGNVSSLLETTIDKDDLYRYLGNIAPNSDMISSVAVQKREAGFGVRVTIVTPDKITQVSNHMYESAAISAGVSDCQILVASTRPVTGESALAGVYKAFDLKGEVFNANQMQISRDELSTVNAINQSNIGIKGYDKESLDKVVLNTKLALQDQFAANGKSLASNEIADLINSYLKDYKLDGIVTGDQIESLTKFFEKFQSTDAINSPSVRKQLELLANKLDTLFRNFQKDAEAAQFWDRIVQFVREVWEAVINAVNGLMATNA